MTVRPAESDDREQIRAIARDSLQSSYSLSPDQIEMILEEEFDDTALTDLLDDSDTTVLVVEETVDDTETVRGFITVEIGTEATIRWLHVDPTARGGGIATALLERVREQYADKPIAACILDEAVEGGEFLEGFGLKQGDHDHLLVGGEEFAVTMFTEGQSTETPTEPTVTVRSPSPSTGLTYPSIATIAFPAVRPRSSRCTLRTARRRCTDTSVHSAAVRTSLSTDSTGWSAGTVATLTWPTSGTMRISDTG